MQFVTRAVLPLEPSRAGVQHRGVAQMTDVVHHAELTPAATVPALYVHGRGDAALPATMQRSGLGGMPSVHAAAIWRAWAVQRAAGAVGGRAISRNFRPLAASKRRSAQAHGLAGRRGPQSEQRCALGTAAILEQGTATFCTGYDPSRHVWPLCSCPTSGFQTRRGTWQCAALHAHNLCRMNATAFSLGLAGQACKLAQCISPATHCW